MTVHVETGHVLAQVAHSVHLNPVRAKVVTAERLLAHRWSSLPFLVSKGRPARLCAETILTESAGLPDTPAGWRRYIDYLGVLAEEEAKLRDEKFGRLSRSWVIASPEFKAEFKKELSQVGSDGARWELRGADSEDRRASKLKASGDPILSFEKSGWSGFRR